MKKVTFVYAVLFSVAFSANALAQSSPPPPPPSNPFDEPCNPPTCTVPIVIYEDEIPSGPIFPKKN